MFLLSKSEIVVTIFVVSTALSLFFQG